MTLGLLLLILAFVAFVLATFNVPLGSLNLVALGLALWVLSMLLGAIAGLSTTTLLIVILVVVLVVVLVAVLRRNAPAAK
jgi:hypothetical protein